MRHVANAEQCKTDWIKTRRKCNGRNDERTNERANKKKKIKNSVNVDKMFEGKSPKKRCMQSNIDG